MNSNSMNYISDEITLQIQQIQLQIISLKCQEKEGTITSAGAAFLDELTNFPPIQEFVRVKFHRLSGKIFLKS